MLYPPRLDRARVRSTEHQTERIPVKNFWLPLVVVAGLIGLNGCRSAGETSAAPTAATAPAAPAKAAWSYEGVTGPSHWGDLDPAWALAKSGKQQSPIDIVRARAVPMPLPPLVVKYEDTSLEILNNGHTIEDDVHGGGTLTVGDQVYRLAQFHFHSPSEHAIDGKHAPMELHLVHKNEKGELAVVGVMIVEGPAHPELAVLWEHLPEEPGRCEEVEGVRVNPSRLLPASLASYRYSGSLTTPPCSENVAWFVLDRPITASAAQIAEFRALIHGNSRPTQPLNGRPVLAAQ
jgi:carbonic anhydrase